MLHSGKKGKVKKLLSFCLSVCLVIGAVTNGRSIAYGDDLNHGDAVAVDMDRILKTLEDTRGEGKTCDLSSLPEEMQTELEDAVIVQKGAVNGLKYYMTAEYMGDGDTESYLDGHQGISIFFVNQSRKKTVEMPAVRMEDNDTCILSMTDEPEQVWEQLEEDEIKEDESGKGDGVRQPGEDEAGEDSGARQPGVNGAEAGTVQQAQENGETREETDESQDRVNDSDKADSTDKVTDGEETEREKEGTPDSAGKTLEMKGIVLQEGKAQKPEEAVPQEGKAQRPEEAVPQEGKAQKPEEAVPLGGKAQNTEEAVPLEERPQDSEITLPEDKTTDSGLSASDSQSEPESPTTGTGQPQDSLNGTDSVDQSSEAGNISTETEYPTVPKATASDAEVGTATPSEAVPDNADSRDDGIWEVNPLSAKRIFIQVQFKAATEECTFITDVTVTTADGGSVSDTPIDIDKLVVIQWNYTIPDEGGVTNGTEYTFEVPEVFYFQNLSFPITNDGKEIGKVTLNGYEGILVFNDTAESDGLLEPGRQGVFSAKGGIDKNHIGNGGLLPFEFTGKIIDIYFPLNPVSADVKLEKSAVLDSTNNKIRWTIKVTPHLDPVQKEEDRKLHSLVIRDKLSAEDGFLMAGSDKSGANFEMLDSNGKELNGGKLSVNSDFKDFTYEFPPDIQAQGDYTVSYDTVFSMNSWNKAATDTLTFKNTANRDFSYYDYTIDSATKKAVLASSATVVNGTAQSEVTEVQTVEGGFVSKVGTKSDDGTKIEWILTLNKNRYSMGNIKVTDTISANSAESVVPDNAISITDIRISNDGGNTYTTAALPSITTDNYQSSFTLNIDSVKDIVIIKYTTSIDDKFRLSNEVTSFSNKVLLTIQPDSGSSIGIEGKGNTISTGYSLLEKSGKYDPATHSILWTIHVNKGKLPLTNAYVKDIIPDGLTLVGEKDDIKSSNGTVELSEGGKEITVSYGLSYEDTDTITFSTTVDNPDLWAVNTAGTNVSNTAHIYAGSGMAQSSYSKTADCNVTSTVFKKSGDGYDPVTKQVKWKLSVNENKMPMNSAVIIDKIPDGQAFVDEGTKESSFTGGVDAIESYAYDKDNNRLTVYLSSPLNEHKDIGYRTVLTDLAILQNNDKMAVVNSAQLSCDEMGGTVKYSESTASQAVSKSIITKTGIPNGSEGTIAWTVKLNQNRIPVENPVLTDKLDANLSLDTSSVKLIRINGDGSETQEAVDASNISYEGNEFVFSFHKTIYDEYRLEFHTYFKVDDSYTNSIDLAGNHGALSLSGVSDRVFAQYMAGGGETRPINKGQVRVIKTDEGTGEAIQGVRFSLSKGAVSQTAVTDEDGIAEFKELWAGTYILKEIDAPDEYYFSPDNQEVITLVNGDEEWNECHITNKRKCGIVVTVKDSENGALLPGAEVRLENKADPSEFYIKETDSNGEVLFGELKEGEYIVSEIKAPPGYNLSSDTPEAVVSSSQDTVQVSLENTAMKGSLRVIKVSKGTDTPLAGARIALYSQDGAKLESKVTGEDGLAEFGPIRYGDYLLVEEEAPEGYILDTTGHPAAFCLTSDGQVMEQKFENQKTPVGSGHGGGGGGGSSAKPGSAPGVNGEAQTNGPGTETGTLTENKLETPSGEKMAQLQKRLPNGNYTMYKLDGRGTILEEQEFVILDSTVPLASVGGYGLPKVGDRRWSVQILAILSGLSLTAILWLRRKRDREELTESKN